MAFQRAQDYAESVGAIVFETSAKANKGIEELFVEISRKIIANRTAPRGAMAAPGGVKLDGDGDGDGGAAPGARACGC